MAEPSGCTTQPNQYYRPNFRLESGRKFQISIPDFKGERFKLILQNETVEEVDNWLRQSDCLLFFLSPNPEKKFNEEYYGVIPQEKKEVPILPEFTIDAIDEWIQNVELAGT